MYVYGIKNADEVKTLDGADIQDLQTAIESEPDLFSEDVKRMAERKLALIRKYGIYTDWHLDEL